MLGYILVGLLTEAVFETYKEGLEKKGVKVSEKESAIKKKIFHDLMPIKDRYVIYDDFQEVMRNQKQWRFFIQKIKNFIAYILASVENFSETQKRELDEKEPVPTRSQPGSRSERQDRGDLGTSAKRGKSSRH